MSQHMAALATAQERRMCHARLKRDVRTDPELLRDWMLEPPAELLDVPLLDLLRWTRSTGRTVRGQQALVDLNGRAVRANVNLMMPLGRASTVTRAWVAENGLRFARRRRSDARA